MADRIETPEAPPQSQPPQTPAERPRPQDAPRDAHRHAAPPPARGFLREHPIKAAVGFILLAALLVGGFLYWNYRQTFEDTDDAFIDGHTNYIGPRISGTVINVMVQENQF